MATKKKPEKHAKKHALTPEMESRKWKPGQSGNPAGRKKGTSITDAINKLIAEGYKGKDVAKMMAESAMKHAMKGNPTYWKEFVERHEGKVAVEMTGKDGAPLIPDNSKLTDEELAQLISLKRKAHGG